MRNLKQMFRGHIPQKPDLILKRMLQTFLLATLLGALVSCASNERASSVETSSANADVLTTVGVTKPSRKAVQRTITVSSELVPFQDIDVYAKEAGYVRDLKVDYGTRVKENQIMAVLEIPELQLQVQQDEAVIKHDQDEVTRAEHDVARYQAQDKILHLQFERLSGVAKTQKGLIAQQELDDAEGKDLSAQAQVESAQSNLAAAESELATMRVKREHDQVLFDYSKITAPFAGVVTRRYANQGTLLQAGTNSSTQAMPLVRLSEDDKFRLVIPVPETYVKFIHVGDPVNVNVSALGRTFAGKVARFSVDVVADTRTMHTEVDVPNTDGTLLPGMYAETTVSLERKQNALTLPLQAINQSGGEATIYVIGPGNKLELRKVMLGIQDANSAEIISGISDNDQIVVSDRSGLKAGQIVNPKVIEVTEYQEQQDK